MAYTHYVIAPVFDGNPYKFISIAKGKHNTPKLYKHFKTIDEVGKFVRGQGGAMGGFGLIGVTRIRLAYLPAMFAGDVPAGKVN